MIRRLWTLLRRDLWWWLVPLVLILAGLLLLVLATDERSIMPSMYDL